MGKYNFEQKVVESPDSIGVYPKKKGVLTDALVIPLGLSPRFFSLPIINQS
jgi:hypothetical protein